MGETNPVISLPSGGGAIEGIGETFSPDLFTGTGNFTVPIALPPGRNGFQPSLSLVYSTGNGNGIFGNGWSLSIPGVARETAHGIPRYQDATDTFVLSGSEKLVPVAGDFPDGVVQYRPRTEGLFARIEYNRDAGNSFWIVRSKDGLISTYGTPGRFGNDPAVIADPANPTHIFSWKLTETVDPFGNRILYDYARDPDPDPEASGRWDQLYLQRIRYVDTAEAHATGEGFLVQVAFEYEPRPDPSSSHRSGFQIRTTRRCRRIAVTTHADMERLVRRYHFVYLDQRVVDNPSDQPTLPIDGQSVATLPRSALPLNGVSLLSQIRIVGHDESQSNPERQTQSLPPLEFGYSRFEPQGRNFFPVQGRDLPAASLASPTLELVDLLGNGLLDIIEMNGTVRYWRNLGGGRFDLPRMMNQAPAGLSFADPGVQLIDANGDGRADLLVNRAGQSGYYSIRFGGYWDRNAFRRYDVAPSFDLEGEDVALVDLDGDGVTDALRSGNRMECYFNDPHSGWGDTLHVTRGPLEEFPDVNLADPRVRFADMTGDGLQDIVLVHDGNLEYWPNLGRGTWGPRVHMRNSPSFPFQYDPRQILIGDVDGDGAADLVFIGHHSITLWINQSGNGWSEPIEIDGTPGFTNQDDVRLVDLLGTGVAGVLWSQSPLAGRRDRYFFHDFTGGVKPYLLDRMDNHRGATTRVAYRSSTEEYVRDQASLDTRWRTTLPFPVQVVSKVEVFDAFSRGRLCTEYRYHHGHWDGGEREFRGFGRVEQLSSETFDRYYDASSSGDFERVEPTHFSPPTITRNWFHLGPVGDEFGGWEAVDHADEYWQEDPPFFASERQALGSFIGGFQDRRDAYRALRGTLLRSELYALDGSGEREQRPYTVTESVYALKEIAVPEDLDATRQRIFFPHQVAQRTTQWERGNDPLTQISYTDDYDDYGQPRRQLGIACPRGWRDFENDARPGTKFLTTYAESTFAQRDDGDGGLYIVDRGASATSFQIFPPREQPAPALTVPQLKEQAFDGTAPRELIGQSFNYFDGEAFQGLPLVTLGEFGALVRTETLVTTEAILADAYRGDDPQAPPVIPPYLDPSGAVNWPPEYPQPFRDTVPPLAGYRFEPGSATHTPGYFVDAVRNRYDFQTPGVESRGLLLAMRDPLERQTTIVFDGFGLLPESVTDPAQLATIARNDYRVFQSDRIEDPNGNRTRVAFSPLGLPLSIAVMGKEGQNAGDTDAVPGTRFDYDLLAFDNSPPEEPQPVFVHTIRRVHHVNDTHIPVEERDDTIETREYSDGFGRLLQVRAQAEDELFGDGVFGNDTLTPDQTDQAATRQPVVGRQRAPDDPPNVVVSGWQIYDNKGQVVQQFEPFYDTGYDYLSLAEAQALRAAGVRDLFGRRVRQFYDPRGQVIRTLNPDGSEQRVIYGVPADLTDPDAFDPTPWEAYTYDANDLAPLSTGTDSLGNPISLADRAPPTHHFTPTSIRIDALGRTIETVQRNRDPQETAAAPLPPIQQIRTRSVYDIRGNLLTVVDALDREAFRYTYDLANNAVRVFSIDAGTKRTVLDALGNPLEQRDSKGALILNAYDALNRPLDLWARDDFTQTATLRQHLVYGDNAGEIGLNAQGAIARNAMGRLVRHYDEAGLLITADYDFTGNLLEKTRQVISDQEILTVFDNPAPDNTVNAYQVDWRPGGVDIDVRAELVLDPTDYTTTTSYDALNRVREVQYPRDVENERKVLRPRYNSAGALKSVSLGVTANGSDNQTFVEHIAYNAKGQRTLIAYGNGTITRYAYDPQTFRLSRMHSGRFTHPSGEPLTFSPAGAALQDYGYDNDIAGNIVRIRDRTPGSGIFNTQLGPNALDKGYIYDAVYQLRGATGRECDRPSLVLPWSDTPRCTDITRTRPYREIYRYDNAGNMTLFRHEHVRTSGSVDAFNRDFTFEIDGGVEAVSNRLDHMTIGQTDFDYVYDASGNLILENTERHFEWNYSNQLKVFRNQIGNAGPTIHAHYLYDASGIRIKKLIRNQGGSVRTTSYIDEIFEHQSRVTTSQQRENNTLHVTHGDSRAALIRVGEFFPDDLLPAVQFQLEDHLGSSGVLVDRNGNELNREEYTPYGETSFGGSPSKRYRFINREREEENGLTYHGARYYACWITNWISADPLGSLDSINLYSYAKNNPISLIDVSGLKSENPPVNNASDAGSIDVSSSGGSIKDVPVVIGTIETTDNLTRREIFIQGLMENIRFEELPHGLSRDRAEKLAEATEETSVFYGGHPDEVLAPGEYSIIWGENAFQEELQRVRNHRLNAPTIQYNQQIDAIHEIGGLLPGAEYVVEGHQFLQAADEEGLVSMGAASAAGTLALGLLPGPNPKMLAKFRKLKSRGYDVPAYALKRWKTKAGATSSGITDRIRKEVKQTPAGMKGPANPVAGHACSAHVCTKQGDVIMIKRQEGWENNFWSPLEKRAAQWRRKYNAANPGKPQLTVRPPGQKRRN